jgi:hypothetical protein
MTLLLGINQLNQSHNQRTNDGQPLPVMCYQPACPSLANENTA